MSSRRDILNFFLLTTTVLFFFFYTIITIFKVKFYLKIDNCWQTILLDILYRDDSSTSHHQHRHAHISRIYIHLRGLREGSLKKKTRTSVSLYTLYELVPRRSDRVCSFFFSPQTVLTFYEDMSIRRPCISNTSVKIKKIKIKIKQQHV